MGHRPPRPQGNQHQGEEQVIYELRFTDDTRQVLDNVTTLEAAKAATRTMLDLGALPEGTVLVQVRPVDPYKAPSKRGRKAT